MLTYADVFWHMLMYADVCWHMLTYADRYLHDARLSVGGNAKLGISSAAPSPRRERDRQQSPRAANRSSAPVRAGDGVRAGGGESPLPRQASNLRSPRSVQAHTAAAKGGAQVRSLVYVLYWYKRTITDA